ncbi:MAG TPA: HAMP domain-containing sensor histidine kinase [Candidatus Solibacter sp.]|nr:HAMP domain-containing sensor histidine kinase [Candidatus Solibacter sp.]
MSLFQHHRWFAVRWFAAAAGISLAFAAVSLVAHKSPGLTAFADLTGLALMLAAAAVTLSNTFTRPAHERSFWLLMTLGFGLWACNQMAWSYREIIARQPIPDPYFFDIILFFHSVPMIAAAAWRIDIAKKRGRIQLAVLSFLMLLGWWLFLYAFLVFPHQYVAMNVNLYNTCYDRLYGLENALLLAALGIATFTSIGGWRRLYLHLFGAGVVYGINSQFLDRAAANNTYYSGSPYDIALIATVAWIAAAMISARDWNLETVEYHLDPRWKKIVPQLAMLTILSLPVLGLWTLLVDTAAPASRHFRLLTVLAAMLLLGLFVFLRQYAQDQALIGLLEESRRRYESQKHLQSQLVQKEKLASLGTLVAGAAHEINHPLNAVMSFSEQLWARERLTDEQHSLLRKIVSQAGRTRDLVTDLLSFAQQAPGEKTLVDLSVLLNRAKQMLEARHAADNISIKLVVAPDFPRVRCNANQLFQSFIEIIENAIDALDQAGGGTLEISAQRQGNDAVLHFSDTGPGIREPQRVFDPFYTTKPVGKGTGLGLSAVYGVIQEHHGQITCQNKPEGGALFIVRFSALHEGVQEGAAQAAVAAQA